MDNDFQQLVFRAIDGTITPEEFDRLQDLIETDDHARDQYLNSVRICQTIGSMTEQDHLESHRPQTFSQPSVGSGRSVESGGWFSGRFSRWDLRSPLWMVVAASTLFLATGSAFWIGTRNPTTLGERPSPAAAEEGAPSERTEALIAGHATLRRSVDLEWPEEISGYREGDVIADGPFAIDSGIAEIDFFCGATLFVEGPAKLEVESDWSVRVIEGRMRATVPPAARGFTVKTTDSEIIDLGTEFALEIGDGNARVKVIDGEIKLQGGKHDGEHLVTGESRWLSGESQQQSFQGITTEGDVDRRLIEAESKRFELWRQSVQVLKHDPRLIAYYPIGLGSGDRTVSNLAASGEDLDGKIIGPVDRTLGRLGSRSSALEFDRPGARVRTRIDGEFQAFTFACWVRIDRLDHLYNSLFMSDGYENGEVHWQIHEDGSLMFSVMVDDTQEIKVRSRYTKAMVRDAGLHRVYFTEPFWDISKSGQWFHLAATYDPQRRVVQQFVNGTRISREEIIDKFYIDSLRIGPAEIGNWGQPFRKSPWFAIRNLNGAIDELAIFDAALDAKEIESLFQQGKPVGY